MKISVVGLGYVGPAAFPAICSILRDGFGSMSMRKKLRG